MKKWLPLIIIVVVLIGIFRWGVGLNNNMVEKQETARTQWANVESAYQRRSDLIPNLVSTVKGYADFEKETFTQVTEARSRVNQINVSSDMLNNPQAFQQFQAAQDLLGKRPLNRPLSEDLPEASQRG